MFLFYFAAFYCNRTSELLDKNLFFECGRAVNFIMLCGIHIGSVLKYLTRIAMLLTSWCEAQKADFLKKITNRFSLAEIEWSSLSQLKNVKFLTTALSSASWDSLLYQLEANIALKSVPLTFINLIKPFTHPGQGPKHVGRESIFWTCVFGKILACFVHIYLV